MRVTLLGTGCPVVHPERGGAATLIEGGGARVLVDCGSGVTQRLVAAGCPGASLDALLVTHLHSDHLVDFYQLVISSWHQRRDRPWLVWCPETVVPVLRAMLDAFVDERALRIAWEQVPSTAGLEVEIRVLVPGEPITIGGLEATPVLVDHPPVEPAYGFVFRAEGRMAVHSGDTAVSERLIAAGQGADLLVHEVFLHRSKPIPPNPDGTPAEDNVAAYHTAQADVGGVAARMGAKVLALTHFVPPEFDRKALLAKVAETYRGPVFVGEDLMWFDLAAGSFGHGPVAARIPQLGQG